jgi:hypothetical protein
MTGPPPDPGAPFDIRADGLHPDAPLVEGIPDDGAESAAHRATGSRAQQESAATAHGAPVQQPVAYTTVEASSTTDPHHDQGSAATGRVEDATPDTHAAGPPVEEAHEETPPPHEEPAPAPVEAAAVEATPAEVHHDDTAATTPDADHTT